MQEGATGRAEISVAKQDELQAAFENGAASIARANFDELNRARINGRRELKEEINKAIYKI